MFSIVHRLQHKKCKGTHTGACIHNRILKTTLTAHFIDRNHDPGSLRYFVTEQIRASSDRDRSRLLHQRESFWIHKLNTLQPFGLNEKIDYSCFL